LLCAEAKLPNLFAHRLMVPSDAEGKSRWNGSSS
jgi:hypothetical protein